MGLYLEYGIVYVAQYMLCSGNEALARKIWQCGDGHTESKKLFTNI